MKIRRGFVSNSSSSSFIIGLGLIKDFSKYQGEIIKNHIRESGLYVQSIKDLKRNPLWDLSVNDKRFQLDSFSYASVDISIDDLDESSLIAVVSINNNEGDSCFQSGKYGDYDIDYDIDLDFFEEKQQSIFKIFNDESIIDKNHSEITFGAGRNG